MVNLYCSRNMLTMTYSRKMIMIMIIQWNMLLNIFLAPSMDVVIIVEGGYYMPMLWSYSSHEYQLGGRTWAMAFGFLTTSLMGGITFMFKCLTWMLDIFLHVGRFGILSTFCWPSWTCSFWKTRSGSHKEFQVWHWRTYLMSVRQGCI